MTMVNNVAKNSKDIIPMLNDAANVLKNVPYFGLVGTIYASASAYATVSFFGKLILIVM